MYATLQEAFGVKSFVSGTKDVTPPAPATTPLVMRGDVGAVASRNDMLVHEQHGTWSVPRKTVKPVKPVPMTLVRAHAQGGAKAAWNVIPPGIRADMMRYVTMLVSRRKNKSPTGARRFFDDDVAIVIAVGLAMLLLMAA
jgi:hypothetical protein